jgi:dynein heavy chain 2
MWGMFEEFQTGLEEMRKEEWIIFRSKLYKFEEYLKSWTEKLNSQE